MEPEIRGLEEGTECPKSPQDGTAVQGELPHLGLSLCLNNQFIIFTYNFTVSIMRLSDHSYCVY